MANHSTPHGPSRPRVAVIGVSGIGKNHARWFAQHGCEVCAFAGSSAATVANSQQVLEAGFGFTGRGYTDVSEMLRTEKPDAVCVSSPPHLHYEHVLASLASGAHVLCEKPLVYEVGAAHYRLREESRVMVAAADDAGRLLATQTQYAAATPTLLELTGHGDASAITDFAMVMETKALRHGSNPLDIWIDLSPHPLSVIQKLAVGGEMELTSIDAQVLEGESQARFRVARPDGSVLNAHVTVRFNPQATVPERRFTLNGQWVDYFGRKDEAGEFRTFLCAQDGREVRMPDLVDALVANFVAACQGTEAVAVTGAAGAQNVDWQLSILEAATNPERKRRANLT